jgi:hypothetical protein
VDSKKLTITKPKVKYTYTNVSNDDDDYNGYGMMGGGYGYQPHRRGHRHANGYENDPVWGSNDVDDPPFTPRIGALPQQQQQRVMDQYPQMDRPDTAGDFERKMAIKMKKIVTQEEFAQETLAEYPLGSEVTARAFEYHYVNQVDDADGFYLYCADLTNPDIVFRVKFLKKNMSEERMVAIAGGEYVYKLVVDRKWWKPMQVGAITARTAGYVMIEASKATCIFGGGIGDETQIPKQENVH